MNKSACLILSGFPIVPTSAVALAFGLLLPGGVSANECLLENSIYFFDKDLRSFYGDSAAPYAFVEGLRYADYYGKGDRGSIEPALGTPIWKFPIAGYSPAHRPPCYRSAVTSTSTTFCSPSLTVRSVSWVASPTFTRSL